MVYWYDICLVVVLFWIIYKCYARKIVNCYKFGSLNDPLKTIIVILDDIGINYEKARRYAKEGARIIIGGQNRTKIENAREELILSTKNKNIFTIDVNGHDKKSLKAFAEELMDSLVTVDVIIDNMGKELLELDINFKTQKLARERFENHCMSFLYVGLPVGCHSILFIKK